MSTNVTIITVITLLLVASPGVAQAGTLTVGSGPGYDFNAIQAAVDAAKSGDTILVAQGTYNENISFNAKDIVLTSTDPHDPNVIAGTVIQGDGTTSVVTIGDNKTYKTRLLGFTITGGDNAVSGGGICVNNPYSSYRPEIIKCVIRGNRADYGGAISGCKGMIVNCLIVENEANILGGGVHDSDNSEIVNCTIANNIGGALDNCRGRAENCIIWGNGDNPITNSAQPVYSCFPGGTSGEGNIDANPKFVDPDNDDYHLQFDSPCIDAGSNGRAMDFVVPYDLDGYPRIIGTVDMGAYEYHDYDCDGNGINDVQDILDGTSPDCNRNWIPDECDIANGTSLDRNSNGIPDECESDCNRNGIPDDWDIATETSTDYNGNGIPDECEDDCNGNGVPDNWDIATETSTDYNGNGIPDECEADCNGNGIPDDWDIATGTSTDDNGNGVPDECETIYADAKAPPAGNGSSWATAYNYLQDALDMAAGSSRIVMVRVAAGTYTPDRGTGDRTATFQLINAVSIRGGYAGLGAPDPNARDVDAYRTILSGDLDSNDVGDLNDPSRGENSYSVVTGSGTKATAVLDGFTITGGNANGSSDNSEGGGIYIIEDRSRPTLTNCTVNGNWAKYGGGLFIAEDSTPRLIGCTISGNSAKHYGGGICIRTFSSPALSDCTISNNTASSGGGIYNSEGSDTILTNCTFTGNSASWGGGMCSADTSPKLINCTFGGNSATYGGGIYAFGNPELINCAFSGNDASRYGGGLYSDGASGSVLRSCTFASNSASKGNAVACDSHEQLYPSNLVVTNCIFWDGRGGVWNNDNSVITISYSDVQGGWQGQGNIDTDPLFVDAPNGDYHLQAYSLCINAGDPDFVPGPDEVDMDGDTRLFATRVDIGADEYVGYMVPVADAGPEQCIAELQLVTLDGSGSHFYEAGGDCTYHWIQDSGPLVQLSDANSVGPAFMPSKSGLYAFELVVNDGSVASLPDTVRIFIGNAYAPKADAGLARYAAQDPVVLDGTGSCSPCGCGSLTYQWKQLSGPPVVVTDANTATPTVSGFSQKSRIQECGFELTVSDGDMNSLPDMVKVIIVPAFNDSVMELENSFFRPGKPTMVFFGGDTGWPSAWLPWKDSLNVINFEYYEAPFERCGDMLIVFLSRVAPNYSQAIQTLGVSAGGMPAPGVGVYLNTTYADSRYNVNHVTLLDACVYSAAICAAFISSSVDGEQCWLDSYRSGPGSFCPGPQIYGALNVYFPEGEHLTPYYWYKASVASKIWSTDMYNHGLAGGAYFSVIGPGKNLQLAPDGTKYHFKWIGDFDPGHIIPSYLDFYNESLYPGRLPEPVTLVGPEDGAVVDSNGAVLTCEVSENAVGYQLLLGPDHYHMDYVISDTPGPPTEIVTAFPFEQTWWTVKVRDQYGTTIYADPRPIRVRNVVYNPIYLGFFTDNWLETGLNMQADLNSDNVINFIDFAIFADKWLTEI